MKEKNSGKKENEYKNVEIIIIHKLKYIFSDPVEFIFTYFFFLYIKLGLTFYRIYILYRINSRGSLNWPSVIIYIYLYLNTGCSMCLDSGSSRINAFRMTVRQTNACWQFYNIFKRFGVMGGLWLGYKFYL